MEDEAQGSVVAEEGGTSLVDPSSKEMSKVSPHWLQDLIKPVPAVSLIVAVLSIVVSIYLFTTQISSPQVSWTSQKQTVFDFRSSNSAITVLDREGNTIVENMYAVQFIVWNSGNTRLDNVDENTI